MILLIISHLFRLPFANLRRVALACDLHQTDSRWTTPRAPASSAASTRVVDVLVPVALNQTYSYRVPRGMELAPGDVVCVPLGPREVVGGGVGGERQSRSAAA